MKKLKFLFFFLSINIICYSQKKQTPKNTKPKLVVGIVLDQMRWDYLYKFAPLFKENGGFKRLMNGGFSCNNTMLPYTPTVTACGHACIYTGSVPNIHGIVGNNWFDINVDEVYCVEDKSVIGIGETKGKAGKMSPKNLLVTTVADELQLATNFKSKVYGVAFKDRGAILPAGHSANAAFWFDKGTGKFISSSHYVNELPTWLNSFNDRKIADSFYKIGWKKSLKVDVYKQYCDDDLNEYEKHTFEKESQGFDYDSLNLYIGNNYNNIITTPHGNTITAMLSKELIANEKLGKGTVTDFLAISFSSTDYIGHVFGPDSWELLDCYVRIDEELGKLLDFLDAQVGKNEYTFFLTADHAVAHIPQYLKNHKIPAGVFNEIEFIKKINTQIEQEFKISKAIANAENDQLYLDKKVFESDSVHNAISKFIVKALLKDTSVYLAYEINNLQQQNINVTLKNMLTNGYYHNRSGHIQYILKSGYINSMKRFSNKKEQGTTHGIWNPYDSHIPLLWFGKGIKKGSTHKETYMTDIAPTLSALLKIQMPSGCIGKVITEVLE